MPFDDVMFGVSPDAFKMSMPVMAQYNKAFKSYIEALIEIKCVVGRERELFYFSDEYMFEEKRKEKRHSLNMENNWQRKCLLTQPFRKLYF